jgi:transmembrane sensor
MESSAVLDRVENQAAAWLLKRESPEWTDADQVALDEWLQTDPNHRVSYIRILVAWQKTDRLRSVSAGLPKGGIPAPGAIRQSPYFTMRQAGVADKSCDIPPPALKPSRARLYAVAASVVVAIACSVIVYAVGMLDGREIYSTPVGGIATIPTEDGSTITLNTDTRVQVQITDTARTIHLRRGEAFFDVAKDAARSFAVYANDQRVVALGTKFSVRVQPDGLRVIVTEGKVRVERTGIGTQDRQTAHSRAAIKAGDIVDVHRGEIIVQQAPMPQIEQALSWRSGYIVFGMTPLAEAIAEFNRYNTRQFVIVDPALQDISVGGNFQVTNVDGFTRLLEKGFAVEAKERDGRIELRKMTKGLVQEP